MQLLKHFKELTVLPKNAQELKGLILQLAIQGKLTANWRKKNPDIEPASELLKRIQKEKQQLVKEKKIRKEKALMQIAKDEIPYELPLSWIWVKLGEVSSLINGDRGKNYPSKEHYIPEGIPFITARNLGDRYLKHDALNYISEERYNLLRSGQVQLNDILYCLRGSLGKCSIVEGIEHGAIASSLVIVRIAELVDSIYMLNYFSSSLGKQMIYKHDNGTAQPNLSASNVKEFYLPLPPLEEQKEIVKVVETLFKEVEQLEQLTVERIKLKEDFVTSALSQLVTNNTKKEWAFLQEHFKSFFNETNNIKKLRETVLQLAVQGKLTADWRSSHPELVSGSHHASQLLKRIQQEKAQLIKEKIIKKEKPLPKITKDEIPYELPEGWVWCRFQEVFDIRDGTHDSPKNVSGVNSYPLVTSKDFKNGEIDFESAKRISKADYDKIILRSLVEEDDILFSMIGGNLGNQVMVKGNTDFAIKNVALFKYYNKSLSVPDFLKTFSEHIAYAVQEKASGGAQPFVSLTFLRQMLVPLPPLEEQKAIVEKVNALMDLCDALEQQVQQSQEQSEQLMQSCLREVFEGKKELI